jgi:TolB-like protein/tRNA A-37 threonylcarbamoyl transferase component Bud32
VIGRHISHFYIIRKLGSGGMGVVYEAQDTRLPRSVAIKFLKPSLAADTIAVKRFKREARLSASLNHPNICTILDIEDGEGEPFIAMELLQGISLRRRLEAGPLTLHELIDIMVQVADALGAAHDHGIMHRDLTPGNIFLTSGGLVKLLDFGLAKQQSSFADDGPVSDDLTAWGATAGTIHYMSPEQLVENGGTDHRSDLFSAGAVLYQMATGTRPFEGVSKNDVIALIRGETQPPVRRFSPEHPQALERIVDRLLAKRPEDRYQTAWTLRADLESLKQPATQVQESAAARPERSEASLAVLPFEVVGGGPHSAQIGVGIAADISGRLGTLRGLRVAPRTSTLALAGESVRDIGRRLGVDFVLEGTVQHTASRVHVIANLIDAARERSVRPPLTVERRFDDLLAVQDDIARDIADQLRPSLVPASGRYAQDTEAYYAFTRGQHHWSSCYAGGWRPAIEQFQTAVERDAQFAPAHVALANAYNFLGLYSLMQPRLAFEVAAESARRALAIDEMLAAAHTQLALAKFGGEWDWDGSEQEFRRALRLDPKDALVHVYYSWLLMLLGRDEAAFHEAQAGQALAPSSRLVRTASAQTLYLAQQYDDAIALCDECLRSDAAYVYALQLRGLCALGKARPSEAIADLQRAATLTERSPFYLGLLGFCYGKFGMRAEALELVAELEQMAPRTYVPSQCYVFIYAGLGQREKALAYQEDAYRDGASPFNYLNPAVRDLYALDPRHQQRLEQMRLVL